MSVEVIASVQGRTAPDQSKFDFFISRAGKDKDVAILIARILRISLAELFSDRA